MNSKIIKVLCKAGLEEKHAKVYLALLELGEATVQDIAEAADMNRTTLYPLLEQLEKQELVAQIIRKKRTYFFAESPAKLLGELKDRVDTFAENLRLFEPFQIHENKKSAVRFFTGAEGFKKIWRVIFESGIKEFQIITDPREMLGFVRSGYIKKKIISEKLKQGIKSRQLIAFSEYGKEIVAKDAKENRTSKTLPHTYKIPFTTIIFGNNVALISPSQENTMLIIESEGFAKTQRAIFDAFWDILPSPK